jgi:hypothetical protein
MSEHECPAPDCQVRVPRHKFVCRSHWYALPKDIRDRVWAGFRHAPLGGAHRQAMADAIEYLEARYTSA